MNEELTEKQRRIRVQETKPGRKRHKDPRQHHAKLGFWRMLSIVVLILVMVLAGMALSGHSVILPNWAARQFEKRVNTAMTSGRVTVGQLQLQVSKRGVPRLQFHNLGVFDGRGAEIVRLNDVGIRVSSTAILKGEIKADRIVLSGAQMTLRRRSDGQFDISFGGGEGATVSLAQALDVLDDVFANAPLDSIDLVEAEALTINVEDGRSGRLWQITDGRMQLSRLPDGLDITVAFDVFNGTEDLAEIVVGVRTDRETSAATIGTTFNNAAAADIALQSPVLSFLGVLNAPISGALRTGFAQDGTLTTLTGSLEIETGALQPTSDTPPVYFESGKAYFDYDPAQEKISFSELSVQTDAISLTANGHAYLSDFEDGWPSTLLVQIGLADLKIDPADVFDDPVVFSKGAMDFRLQLDPFIVDIGQIVLSEGTERLQADGKISAKDKGWQVSANMTLNQMDYPRLMTLWPPVLVPKTRKWLSENVFGGLVRDVTAAVRLETGKEPRHSLGFRFEDATVRYIKTLPHIKNGTGFGSISDKRFTLALENGTVTAPTGGDIFVRGTTLTIENVTQKPATMHVDLTGNASITAALSLLSVPPFQVLKNSKLPVDMAQGQVQFDGKASFPMKKKLQLESVSYQVAGRLIDVSTDVLVKNRTITAKELSLTANKQFVEISGAAQLGKATGNVTWHQKMGPQNAGTSDLTGTIAFSRGFSEEFSLGLPADAITGSGHGDIKIQFRKDTPPEYQLTSDLSQVGIKIAPIGWTKSRNSTGSLSVAGTLGDTPSISQFSLTAPDLTVSGGRVSLRSGGGLNKATFDRVRVGGWLDAPVELTGRGNGVSPSVTVLGGELDIRKTSFGGAGGQTSKPARGRLRWIV